MNRIFDDVDGERSRSLGNSRAISPATRRMWEQEERRSRNLTLTLRICAIIIAIGILAALGLGHG